MYLQIYSNILKDVLFGQLWDILFLELGCIEICSEESVVQTSIFPRARHIAEFIVYTNQGIYGKCLLCILSWPSSHSVYSTFGWQVCRHILWIHCEALNQPRVKIPFNMSPLNHGGKQSVHFLNLSALKPFLHPTGSSRKNVKSKNIFTQI